MNKYLSIKFNKIDIYNLELYKPFFILKNLKKIEGKYRYLLKNIISELLLLMYAYKSIASVLGNLILADLMRNIILDNINIDCFLNANKKLKKSKFN